MRKKVERVVALAAIVVAAGCAGNGKMIESMGSGSSTGVFERLEPGGVAPRTGYTDLHVSASIRTHGEDAFVFNSCSHGSADYTLLLNIDGQPMQLTGKKTGERMASAGNGDPEAGNGCRYLFEATVRLRAGRHLVTVAIPEDEVLVTREVPLPEGAAYLTVRPVYRKAAKRRIGASGESAFRGGVQAVQLLIDGKEV